MLMSVSAGPAESQTCSSTIEVMATDSHVPQTIPIFQLRHAFGRGLSPAPFPRVHWTSCQGVGGQRGTTGQWRQWSVFHYSDNCGILGDTVSVRPVLKVGMKVGGRDRVRCRSKNEPPGEWADLKQLFHYATSSVTQQ